MIIDHDTRLERLRRTKPQISNTAPITNNKQKHRAQKQVGSGVRGKIDRVASWGLGFYFVLSLARSMGHITTHHEREPWEVWEAFQYQRVHTKFCNKVAPSRRKAR
jgi:hypothetical protein